MNWTFLFQWTERYTNELNLFFNELNVTQMNWTFFSMNWTLVHNELNSDFDVNELNCMYFDEIHKSIFISEMLVRS